MTDDTDVRFHCPGCDAALDVSAGAAGQALQCPICGVEFLAAMDDGPSAAALDAVRVRQLSEWRRATLRVRSWWLIGLLLSAVAAVDLTGKAAWYVWARHNWGWWPTLVLMGAVVAGGVSMACGRAARHLEREAATPSRPDPATPPDFSTLSNGADRWRQLEDVR